MKKIITLFAITFCLQINAQYSKLHDFDSTNGATVQGSLMQASDEMLYGMTNQGGAIGEGVLFQYNPATNTYTKKLDFAGTGATIDGSNPRGSLMQASDGMLYGMTSYGGANNDGVLFQYNPATNTYIKKLDFAGTINGQQPCGSLMQAIDGMLYGMTASGGAIGDGVLFQYNPATNTYTKKLDFDSTNGSLPYGSLMQASDGMLYGMTSKGGANNDGVLFQYNPSTSAYTKKHDFAAVVTTGYNPWGVLMQASDGMLYGMTSYGGANNDGVLFQYNPTTSTYNKKLDFTGATNGSSPFGSLMQASDSMLYGMTSYGGANNKGIIFQYNPTTNTCTKMLDFAGTTNGSLPYGNLLQASNGVLYGTTDSGGANSGANTYWTHGMGVLFSFCIGSPAITINSATICVGSTATLTASGVTTYSWSNSATTASITATPSVTTSYTVTGSNTCGLGTATSTVTVNNLPTIIVNSGVICAGQSFTITPSGANIYNYSSGSAVVSPTVNTSYTVTGTDVNNCTNTETNTITVNTLPTLTVTASTQTICIGGTSTLTASGASSYTWANTGATGGSIIPTPTVTTNYTVTGTDGNGCMNMDTLSVIVENCTTGINEFVNSNEIIIYPNPNNGNFIIETNSSEEQTLKIFDVTGNLVLSQSINDKTNIDAVRLSDGVYNISIPNSKGVINRRIVITK